MLIKNRCRIILFSFAMTNFCRLLNRQSEHENFRTGHNGFTRSHRVRDCKSLCWQGKVEGLQIVGSLDERPSWLAATIWWRVGKCNLLPWLTSTKILWRMLKNMYHTNFGDSKALTNMHGILVLELSQRRIWEFFFWYLLLKCSTKIWSLNIRWYLMKILIPEKQAQWSDSSQIPSDIRRSDFSNRFW